MGLIFFFGTRFFLFDDVHTVHLFFLLSIDILSFLRIMHRKWMEK